MSTMPYGHTATDTDMTVRSVLKALSLVVLGILLGFAFEFVMPRWRPRQAAAGTHCHGAKNSTVA